MSKVRKTVLLVILILVLLAFSAGLVAGNFFYELALVPGTDKTAVFKAPHNTITIELSQTEHDAYQREQAEQDVWREAVPTEDYHTLSFDGLQMYARCYPQSTAGAPWVIICHGYGGSNGQMVLPAWQFHQRGYNVLVPDARGLGKSQGDYMGMGWEDRLDVVAWIDSILAGDPAADIVLFGVSMGGATVMMTAGEELPSNVRAIIEDCGYSSIWGEFSYQLGQIFGLPAFPLMQFASLMSFARAGWWLGEGDAVAQVAKSNTPMLFIHGDEDTFVPVAMVEEVYAAASCPKEKLVVEGAGHALSATRDPELYWGTVDSFLARYLAAES